MTLEKTVTQNHNDKEILKQVPQPKQTTLEGHDIHDLRTEYAQKQRSASGHSEEEYILHPETPDDHPET